MEADLEDADVAIPVPADRRRKHRPKPLSVDGPDAWQAAHAEELPYGRPVERPERGHLQGDEMELRGVDVRRHDLGGPGQRSVERLVPGRADRDHPVAGSDLQAGRIDLVVLPDAREDDPAAQGADARRHGGPSESHRWFRPPRVLAVGAIWAAAEALLFVVVPDVWVGLVAIRAPRRAAATLASIVLGAAAGAALLWLPGAARGPPRPPLPPPPGVFAPPPAPGGTPHRTPRPPP